MAYVHKLSVCGEAKAGPSWEDVEASIAELRQGDDVWISIGDEADENWLVVYWIAEYGYYVSGCGRGDDDYYSLVDPRLGSEVVEAYVAGENASYVRNAFVDETTMREALREFFETGRRKESAHWEVTSTVMRD